LFVLLRLRLLFLLHLLLFLFLLLLLLLLDHSSDHRARAVACPVSDVVVARAPPNR